MESNEMIQRNTHSQWGIISDETEEKIDQNQQATNWFGMIRKLLFMYVCTQHESL